MSELKLLYSRNRANISQTSVHSSVSRLNVFYESYYCSHVSESAQILPSTLMGTIGAFLYRLIEKQILNALTLIFLIRNILFMALIYI